MSQLQADYTQFVRKLEESKRQTNQNLTFTEQMISERTRIEKLKVLGQTCKFVEHQYRQVPFSSLLVLLAQTSKKTPGFQLPLYPYATGNQQGKFTTFKTNDGFLAKGPLVDATDL